MIRKFLGIILLCPAVLAQVDVIQPDVSFTENNDRFDLSSMWGAQDKKAYRDIPLADDDDDDDANGDDDFRRQFRNDNTRQISELLKSKDPGYIFLTRKADGGFAYDDRMDSNEGGTMSDFEANLKHFKTDLKQSRRKNPDEDEHAYGFKKIITSESSLSDKDVLMHHVVPIVMKVNGFLKAPL